MNVERSFDSWRYARNSLGHYWRVNLAVMVGIVTGTAVLTGALVVGDSVRESLRRLIVERLGRTDEILISNHFFSVDILGRTQGDGDSLAGFTDVVPAILFPSTSLEHAGDEHTYRAPHVTVIGSDASFWNLGVPDVRPKRLPTGREIVLNEPLARQLNATVGDRVVVRLAKESRIAADSTLADTSDLTRSLAELEVVEIIPASGLGRFSLQSNQVTPQTAFLSLETLQQALDQPSQINALLFGGPDANRAPAAATTDRLRQSIKPTLEDAGLNLKRVQLSFLNEQRGEQQPVLEYYSLSTDSMVFSEQAEAAMSEALSGLEVQRVMTYLANSIARVDDEGGTGIPYSTVSAVDSTQTLGPLLQPGGDVIGPLSDTEIVLNSWAADDLGVEVGDSVRMTYFEPETTHGDPQETTKTFTLKAVVPLKPPLLPFDGDTPARYVSAPSFANDPDLTPEVPGVTDQSSIDQWDPPFPFEYGRIRNPTDEDYWDNYRTTPKAFVAEPTGRSIWKSRFGETTSFRVAITEGVSEDSLRERLEAAVSHNLEPFGFSFVHAKADGLKAAKGTTPFNMLFLGFSFFIIAAALMLVALLARLAIEQRSANAGLLLAVGLNRRSVIRLFLIESLMLSVIGAAIGGVCGIAYADLMLIGLRTWWVDAIATPFLQLNVGPVSLIVGIVCGIVTSSLTIVWTVFALRKIEIRDLLSGNIADDSAIVAGLGGIGRWLPGVLFVMAVALAIAATFLGGEAQAGAFFGSGASVLLAMLLLTSRQLKRSGHTASRVGKWTFPRFVIRNVSRNPRRSTLTIGLMAAACFLIVAISAFRLSPTDEGTGGFDLLAQSDWPVFDDLSDAEAREGNLGTESDAFAGTSILSLRMREGDDASCRNLYQSQRPRLIGFTSSAIGRFDESSEHSFAWAGSAAETEAERENPWHLLNADRGDAIPVVLDKNTAMYSLHLYKGVGERFELDYGAGGKLQFEVVGLLTNSILQGSLVISDDNLLRLFPETGGYRFFLIDVGTAKATDVRRILEDAYADQGLVTNDAKQLLAELLAVQNTYLSTFQSLGGLGLLLGTFGLAAVQLRSIFERRQELALLRATGFAANRIAKFVLAEHLVLLFSGLGIGLLAALIAVLPHAWSGGAHPPWSTLVFVLGTILFVGIGTGALGVARAIGALVIESLRDE